MPSLPKLKKASLPQGNLMGGDTKLCQAAVPVSLYEAAKQEWKARGLTARHVVTWALHEFLLATNPKRAGKLKRPKL